MPHDPDSGEQVRVRGDAIYAAAPRLPRPSTEPGGRALGQALLEDVRLWVFVDEVGADLIVGWIGAALLGGAPDWRPSLHFELAPF